MALMLMITNALYMWHCISTPAPLAHRGRRVVPQPTPFVDEHIDKTQKHIDMIGERVVRLGGVPTAHLVTQHELSYIKHEVKAAIHADFLRNDLEHELKLQVDASRSRAHELVTRHRRGVGRGSQRP